MAFCHCGTRTTGSGCRWPSTGKQPRSASHPWSVTSFPFTTAYTAGVVTTLVIAGTGAYVLGRVLRLGFLGALMTATVFELAGPLVAWLGYPQAQVLAWGGWLMAAGVLVVRGKRRVPSITLFAVVLACAIYAGHPETLIVTVGAALLFLILLLALRALPLHLGFGAGPIRRPAVDLVMAIGAGLALGAPLLLPALQLTATSVRSTSGGTSTLPVHDLLFLVFSSFDGAPVTGNYGFGQSFYYNQTAAYVGLVVVVLAAMAVVIGLRRRRPEVLAITAVAVVMGAIVYLAPATFLANNVPLLDKVAWLRALMPLSLALAVLAGVGLDLVVRSPASRAVRISLLSGFGAAAVLLAGLWLFGRGGGLPSFGASVAAHARAESFVWPAVGAVVGVTGAALLWWRFRLRNVVALALLICEAGFLIAAGSIQIASSDDGFPPTPVVSALAHAVGGATVGTGSCGLGITPEANIAYQIRELDLYDPIVPKAYFTTWQKETGTSGGSTVWDQFCPAIRTAAEARLLGVGYVLNASSTPAPPGSVFVTELRPADPYSPRDVLQEAPTAEDLYRIPGAARAVVIPVQPRAALPPPDSPGTPVTVTDSNPARWSLTTDAPTASVLRLHLTDVPGWHATIDGRPLQLESFSGIMLQARIPPGHHVIELHYWPTTFTVGLIVAVTAVVVLAVALFCTELLPRRRGRRGVLET